MTQDNGRRSDEPPPTSGIYRQLALLALLVLSLVGDAARTFHRAARILHEAKTFVVGKQRIATWTPPRPGIGCGCHDADSKTMIVAGFRRIVLSNEHFIAPKRA
ncbi:hypothetical protein DFJ73DRAFT_786331 [Zopfochytrium polystomum]|nr:hypothetical protein DFJ73DRAFT_786331 [Zopfochytrium polystomum]